MARTAWVFSGRRRKRGKRVTEVIVHAGVHKTGSSSIQQALQSPLNALIFEREGIWIPRNLPANQSHFFVSAFGLRPERYHANVRDGLGPREVKDLVKGQVKRLLSDLGRARFQKIVFSGEDISTLAPKELENLRAAFNEWFGVDAQVGFALYSRRPESFVESAIQQNVKGNGMTIERSRAWHVQSCHEKYKTIVERVELVFGPDAVQVYGFEDSTSRFGSVVRHFGKVVLRGLELSDPERQNSAISDQTVRFLSECHADGHAVGLDDQKLLGQLPGSHGSLLTEGDRKEIAELSLGDRIFLHERFGIDYRDPPTEKSNGRRDDSGYCEAAKLILPLLEPSTKSRFAEFLSRIREEH